MEYHLVFLNGALVKNFSGNVLGSDVDALAAGFIKYIREQAHLELEAQNIHLGDVLLAAFQDHCFYKEACYG